LAASNSNLSCRLCELARVDEGTMRVAPLFGLPRLLARHGLDADTVIREAGCDPALFGSSENTIPVSKVGRLLAHVAGITGCPHLALDLVRDMGLDVLGIVGQTARLAPDVGAALRTLILHLHLHNRGAVPSLWEGGIQAMFGYTIHCPDASGTEYIYDGALAIMHNLLTELAGPDWKATEVRLNRDEPKDITPYRRHFRAHLRFGAERSAIVFPAADLARPLASADSIAHARMLRKLDELDALSKAGLAVKVRRLLRRLLIAGSGPDGLDLDKVARLFALHPRALNRRLQAEGTTFGALMGEVRYEIARQLLRDTHLQAADIAYVLGYADSSSFTHAFRRWSGTTATTWRSAHRPS
jgi:AraC-like DNA-binding protein